MTLADAGWLAVESLPVGLITWFSPEGGAVAAPASWLAVVNGPPALLRAGGFGRGPGSDELPTGLDFAVNIPADLALPRQLMGKASCRGPVLIDDIAGLAPARLVHAPLLTGCALQIECAHGLIVPGDWDLELVGEVILLHRGDFFLDPANHPDFCALRPLHAIFPS